MAALSTFSLTNAGTAPTFAAATTSDTAQVGNGGNVFVVYKNTDASPKTVTVTVAGSTDYGQPNPDPQYTVAATTGEVWIPMRKEYNDGTGRAALTLSNATGVTVAVVKVSA
ncbi:hypothetical protein [Nocardia sp. NPDC057440]|uniref:hypothetical protein n=1 Tax=Nocardia sp. NPDC057440 TaxID=3346134 RepID=UPI003672B885